MKRTEIRQLFAAPESFDGAEVTVCGWVRTIRDSKAIGFIELNDGSAFKNLQIILETEKVSNFAEIVKLNVGSAICVRGRVILTPHVSGNYNQQSTYDTVIAMAVENLQRYLDKQPLKYRVDRKSGYRVSNNQE